MIIKKNREAIRFIVLFLGVFILLQIIWFYTSKTIEPYISETLHVKPISSLIVLATPSVTASPIGKSIVSDGFSLSVDSACNGIDSIILVVSAVLAFRANILKKIAGVISGCLLLYLFNILRITILFYSNVFAPDFFDFLHVYAGQTLVVIAGVAFFFLWASWATSEKFENSGTL